MFSTNMFFNTSVQTANIISQRKLLSWEEKSSIVQQVL